MSYGANVFNADGNVMLDLFLPQMPLKASGSVNVPAYPNLAQPSYGVTMTRPMLFVRPRNQNQTLLIGNIGLSGFECKLITDRSVAQTGGIVDWRVYETSGIAWDDLDYGMELFNPSGNKIYATSNKPPFIKGIAPVLLGPYESANGTFTPGLNSETLANITYNFTSYDGGLPYVNANSLVAIYFIAGPGMRVVMNSGITWTSSTTCTYASDIWFASIQYISGTAYTSNQRPLNSMAIR